MCTAAFNTDTSQHAILFLNVFGIVDSIEFISSDFIMS